MGRGVRVASSSNPRKSLKERYAKRKQSKAQMIGLRYTAEDIARLRNGAAAPTVGASARGAVTRAISMKESNAAYRSDHDAIAKKVFISMAALVVLAFLSLGIMGAAGQYYPYSASYTLYDPVQVANVLYEHAYNAVGSITHWYTPHDNVYLRENVPGYWAVMQRAGVVGITLICAILLSVSGMLYQNVFKNPIAGPGMLGAGSGVNLGMMIIVYLYGAAGLSMMELRYELCYGLGAGVLLFVMLAGRKLSGKGKPFDIITMLLVGSIIGQLFGFVTSYVTLFLMDEEDYQIFYTISQMLVVDTSLISWIALGVASAVSLIPVIAMRYKFTALALDEADVRTLGLNIVTLRGVALICGAIMILAAQIHVGMVSLVSLIVPFLSRSWFGCEFNKQLIGNVCIGTVLLLIARDITDLIPFIGDGLAIGSIMSVVALPLFVVIMAKHMRGWE